MPRLGGGRGRELRVQQTNVEDGEIYVVREQDYIDGPFDPEHYTILSYGEQRRRPKLDKSGAVVMYPDSDVPVMVTVYDEIDPADVKRIEAAAADERAQATEEADAIVAGEINTHTRG